MWVTDYTTLRIYYHMGCSFSCTVGYLGRGQYMCQIRLNRFESLVIIAKVLNHSSITTINMNISAMG